jgi:2-phospho-L-lactate guanylyltransferase
MTGSAWGVIPVKHLASAKSRLAPTLSPEDRRRLVLCMLEDVLTAAAAVIPARHILVVTPDHDVAALARRSGAPVLADRAPAGSGAEPAASLNFAVATGISHVVARGGKQVLILPADVPLATADDIARVLAATSPGAAQLAVVPSADGEGTNAMALSPPGIMTPRFGPDSFAAHVAAAAARRIDTRVLHIPGLARDIDTPADLARLIREGISERYAFLRAVPGAGPRAPAPGFEP